MQQPVDLEDAPLDQVHRLRLAVVEGLAVDVEEADEHDRHPPPLLRLLRTLPRVHTRRDGVRHEAAHRLLHRPERVIALAEGLEGGGAHGLRGHRRPDLHLVDDEVAQLQVHPVHHPLPRHRPRHRLGGLDELEYGLAQDRLPALGQLPAVLGLRQRRPRHHKLRLVKRAPERHAPDVAGADADVEEELRVQRVHPHLLHGLEPLLRLLQHVKAAGDGARGRDRERLVPEHDEHGVACKVNHVAVILVDEANLEGEHRVHHHVELLCGLAHGHLRRLPRVLGHVRLAQLREP
mmetsp:Transcript_2833/g.6617  ORF Transcript_2833/g.6617 Transcript_2833/m.6617 type:complete len:292 (+) Transcript_2833:564-1439(+)